MSKLFVTVVVAVVLCAMQTPVQCRAVGDSSAASAPIVTLAELVKGTDDTFQKLQANFLQFVGAKDTTELNSIVQARTKTFADQLQTTVTQITEEAKKSPAGDLLREFTGKLTSQIDGWKQANPETVQTAEKVQQNLENGLKGVVAETQQFNADLAKQGDGINENVQKLLRQLYSSTLETAKAVSTQIEEVANKKA